MKRRNRWETRIAIIGLAVLLMAGSMPMRQAYALPSAVAVNVVTETRYTDLQTAINSASEGDTIQLISDIDIGTSGSPIAYNNPDTEVALDLNGRHLIRQAPAGMLDGGDGAALHIVSGTLDIEDSSAGQSGSIRLRNANIGELSGSAVNIAASGTLNLASGSLIGDGQGIYAYESGAHLHISGGLVYGSTDSNFSEGIVAVGGTYGSISGGYIGTASAASSMIFTFGSFTSEYWSLTGGYFTTDSYFSDSLHRISDFIASGTMLALREAATHPETGGTKFAYRLVQLNRETMPSASIDPINEALRGLEPGSDYEINETTTYTADSAGTIPLAAEWISSQAELNLSLVKKGVENMSVDSLSQNLTIPKRPAAPNVTAEDDLDQITGIAGTTEISVDGGSWLPYSPNNLPQLGGDHTVKVRYAASLIPPAFASEAKMLTFTVALPGHKVVGSVSERIANLPAGVQGADVHLYRGTEKAGSGAVTDANGSFAIRGVADGAYNLVVTKDKRTVTYLVTVKNGDYNLPEPIMLPEGNANSRVSISGSGTPAIAVGGLQELFQDTSYSFLPADQQVIADGGTVSLELAAEKKDQSVANGADAIRALAAVQKRQINLYLDLSLIKTTTLFGGASSSQPLSETGSLLQIVVPYNLSGQTDVAVYRYHNGVAQALPAWFDGSGSPAREGYLLRPADNQIVIWSQNFSTYAIASAISNPDTGSGNGNTGVADPVGGSASVPADASVTVTVKSSAGGTVNPSGTRQAAKGSNLTLIFTPDAGYFIQDVLIDGKSAGAVNAYTFNRLSVSHHVEIVFAKSPAQAEASTDSLPYYLDGDRKVFIGFAAPVDGKMKYIAPAGKEVFFQPNVHTFADMNGHWAEEPVGFLAARELFLGAGDDRFAPQEGMTRAMFAAVLGRLYERSYGSLGSEARTFSDVREGVWYETYVGWAARTGIAQGNGMAAFEPDRKITRQEMAAMLYRFASMLHMSVNAQTISETAYADQAEIAVWAAPAVAYFAQNGVFEGRKDHTFAPKAIAERSEAAAVLRRFIETTVKRIAQ